MINLKTNPLLMALCLSSLGGVYAADFTLSEIQEIEHKIGYHFNNSDYLTHAFTHPSYCTSVNHLKTKAQHLETLGDSLLTQTVVSYFSERHEEASQEEISSFRSEKTNNRYLAKVCERIGLSAFIKSNPDTAASGAETLLADTLESLVGAIYKDSKEVFGDGHPSPQNFIKQFILSEEESPKETLLPPPFPLSSLQPSSLAHIQKEYEDIDYEGLDFDNHKLSKKKVAQQRTLATQGEVTAKLALGLHYIAIESYQEAFKQLKGVDSAEAWYARSEIIWHYETDDNLQDKKHNLGSDAFYLSYEYCIKKTLEANLQHSFARLEKVFLDLKSQYGQSKDQIINTLYEVAFNENVSENNRNYAEKKLIELYGAWATQSSLSASSIYKLCQLPAEKGESTAIKKIISLLEKKSVSLQNKNETAVILRHYQTLASFDDKEAWYQLGLFYEEGKGGVSRNIDDARYCFEKAKQKGSQEAVSKLLSLRVSAHFDVKSHLERARHAYEVGDFYTSFYLYQSVTTQDPHSHSALFWLGKFYQYGIGCEIDFNKSKEFYKEAFDRGHQEAGFQLALLYEFQGRHGQREAINLHTAQRKKLISDISDLSFSSYSYSYSNVRNQWKALKDKMTSYHRNSSVSSYERDETKAKEIYQALSQRGYGAAFYRLSVLEMETNRYNFRQENNQKILSSLEDAIRRGDTNASFHLSIIYMKGLYGKSKNMTQALSYISSLAPHPIACLLLGYAALEGTPQQENVALEWITLGEKNLNLTMSS